MAPGPCQGCGNGWYEHGGCSNTECHNPIGPVLARRMRRQRQEDSWPQPVAQPHPGGLPNCVADLLSYLGLSDSISQSSNAEGPVHAEQPRVVYSLGMRTDRLTWGGAICHTVCDDSYEPYWSPAFRSRIHRADVVLTGSTRRYGGRGGLNGTNLETQIQIAVNFPGPLRSLVESIVGEIRAGVPHIWCGCASGCHRSVAAVAIAVAVAARRWPHVPVQAIHLELHPDYRPPHDGGLQSRWELAACASMDKWMAIR